MSRVKRFPLALGLAVVIHLAQVFLSMPGGVQSAPPTSGIQYVDVTKASGLTFRHNSGASGKKYLPETLGPGVAFIDYNGDGWQDLFFTNGKDWPGQRQRPSTLELFRNNKNGTFSNVTAASGLNREVYGMGSAVGDFDNDGDEDLFVSTLGQSLLFRNNSGVFQDVTKESGLSGPEEFSTSAAWLDYDKDGRLDLFVANYVQWSIATDIRCSLDGTEKSYCTPESYKGSSARLWRNKGGTFQDVTKEAGVFDATSKGLGVTVLDANQDLWPDLFLANDTQPNRLYLNTGKGTFTEKGIMAGIAYSELGVARAGMGVAAADYDRSGFPSVLITNFSNEMLALYHNEGNGLFVDEAPRSEVGRKSLLTLGFGCFFFDYDLDGWLDIFVANGHHRTEHRTHPVDDQVCADSSFVSKRREGQVPGGHSIRGRCVRQAAGRARGGLWRLRQRWRPRYRHDDERWTGRSAPQRRWRQPEPPLASCRNPIEP